MVKMRDTDTGTTKLAWVKTALISIGTILALFFPDVLPDGWVEIVYTAIVAVYAAVDLFIGYFTNKKELPEETKPTVK